MSENNENLNEYSAEDIDQEIIVDFDNDGIFNIQFNGTIYEGTSFTGMDTTLLNYRIVTCEVT